MEPDHIAKLRNIFQQYEEQRREGKGYQRGLSTTSEGDPAILLPPTRPDDLQSPPRMIPFRTIIGTLLERLSVLQSRVEVASASEAAWRNVSALAGHLQAFSVLRWPTGYTLQADYDAPSIAIAADDFMLLVEKASERFADVLNAPPQPRPDNVSTIAVGAPLLPLVKADIANWTETAKQGSGNLQPVQFASVGDEVWQGPSDPVVVWDLETSGLNVDQGAQILEIGALVIAGGKIVGERSWLLKHATVCIDDKITELTGITQGMIDAEGQAPEVCLREFLALFPVPRHVTHNGIRFDIPFLLTSCRNYSIEPPNALAQLSESMYATAIDTAAIFKGRKLGMEQGVDEPFKRYANRVMAIHAKGLKYNVGICCSELGVERAGLVQRRALADVRLTAAIYHKLMTSKEG